MAQNVANQLEDIRTKILKKETEITENENQLNEARGQDPVDNIRVSFLQNRDVALRNQDAALQNRDAALRTEHAALHNRDAALINQDVERRREAAQPREDEERAAADTSSVDNALNGCWPGLAEEVDLFVRKKLKDGGLDTEEKLKAANYDALLASGIGKKAASKIYRAIQPWWKRSWEASKFAILLLFGLGLINGVVTAVCTKFSWGLYKSILLAASVDAVWIGFATFVFRKK